jgi:EmrB/QacA subfamily drug resistance transporter
MCLTVAMVQLDTTIVNLGVHAIETGLHASVATLQWVVDAYNLTYAAFIVAAGAFGDRYGRKRVFIIGTSLFAVACLACTLATGPQMLVIARAVAGLGAAIAIPTSFAILTDAYENAAERARTFALWAGCNGVGIALGPTLGGLLIHAFGWRSIFFVTVPVAITTIVLAWISVKRTHAKSAHLADVSSIGLSACVLLAFAYGAIEHSLPAFGIALVGLFGFVWRQRAAAYPLVPLEAFRVVRFDAALAAIACMTFGMYAFFFALPRFVQTEMYASAFTTGLTLLPCGILFMASSPFATKLAETIGSRLAVALGMGCIAIALFGVLGLLEIRSLVLFAAIGGLTGIGMGIASGPVMSLAVETFARERAGIASGLVNMGRVVGALMGVAFLGALAVGADMTIAGGVELLGCLTILAFARSDLFLLLEEPEIVAVAGVHQMGLELKALLGVTILADIVRVFDRPARAIGVLGDFRPDFHLGDVAGRELVALAGLDELRPLRVVPVRDHVRDVEVRRPVDGDPCAPVGLVEDGHAVDVGARRRRRQKAAHDHECDGQGDGTEKCFHGNSLRLARLRHAVRRSGERRSDADLREDRAIGVDALVVIVVIGDRPTGAVAVAGELGPDLDLCRQRNAGRIREAHVEDVRALVADETRPAIRLAFDRPGRIDASPIDGDPRARVRDVLHVDGDHGRLRDGLGRSRSDAQRHEQRQKRKCELLHAT